MAGLEEVGEALDGGSSAGRLHVCQHRVFSCYKESRQHGPCGRQAYVGNVDAQRPNVWAAHPLEQQLIIRTIADDKHNEALALQIQCQRSRQRQCRRSRHYDDLDTAIILGALCPADLARRVCGAVCAVGDGSGDKDGDADDDAVAHKPVLDFLDDGGRDDGLGRRRRQRGLNGRRQPVGRGERLADGAGGGLDVLVDKVGNGVGVALQLAGQAVDLDSQRWLVEMDRQSRKIRRAEHTMSISWSVDMATASF